MIKKLQKKTLLLYYVINQAGKLNKDNGNVAWHVKVTEVQHRSAPSYKDSALFTIVLFTKKCHSLISDGLDVESLMAIFLCISRRNFLTA